MDMDIEPVSIKVTGAAPFTATVFLLDQGHLLDDFSIIRKLWGLNKKLVPYESYAHWRQTAHDFPLSPKASGLLYEAKDTISEGGRYSDDDSKVREIAFLNRLDFEIEQLLRRYGIPAVFRDLVLRALVCGEVRDGDLQQLKNDKHFSYGDWIYQVSNVYIPTSKKPKTKREVIRDRMWYWEHRQGKSYLQIAKDAPERGMIDPTLYKDNVKMQVKRYELLLSGGNK